MAFYLQLLGLFVIFLLILFYFSHDDFIRGNRFFRILLLVGYMIEILYVANFVVLEANGNGFLIGKLYVLAIFVFVSLFTLYLVTKIGKNCEKGSISKKFSLGYFLIQVIGMVVLWLTEVKIIDQQIDFQSHILVVFMSIYAVINIVLLLLKREQFDTYKWGHLFVVSFGMVFMIGLQSCLPSLAVINTGIVLMLLYLYITLENMDRKTIEALQLENQYIQKQNIDKSSFLKNLSHQIRTPLNTIDGFSQVILDSNHLDEIKDDVADIRVASRDLIDVINGMIDLEIIESGNLEIILENYNVYDMLEGIVEITNSKLRDKEVEFVTTIDDKIPEVLVGDSERISQVILNLLTNAIKYTSKGKITLRVESVQSSSICRLKIIVEDTGRGIEKEELQTIFEQKDKNRIGLAVSKHLVELMNGTIEVDSQVDMGSVFTVTFDQKIISDKAEVKVSRKKNLKPFDASGRRILLVDDNKLNLKVASKLLQPYQVEVVEVSSGQECIDMLEKDRNFDFILMDDLMPEMSGSECLDIIKKIERVDGYYIPVVVLTANAVSGMREKYLSIGFEDYLSKPIDKYELDRILKKYLKGKK